MAVKFAGTMNAINRGLEDTKPGKGVDMIEDWEAALADVDVPCQSASKKDPLSACKRDPLRRAA